MSELENRDEEIIAYSQMATHDPSDTFDPLRSLLETKTIEGVQPDIEEQLVEVTLPTTNTLPKGKKTQSSATFWRQKIQQRVGGRFQLKNVIGRGGFGEVWEASQNSLDRVVAVKTLRRDRLERCPDDDSRGQVLSMFLSEAQTAASLDHPNILPIYDLGSDGGEEPMIAMKRVRGNPWDDMIDDDRDELPYDEYLEKHLSILEDVCQACAFAHSRGILHRDLKAEQVMVGRFGEVLLMDWGLAVVFDGEALSGGSSDIMPDWGTPITSASSPAGTPAFMAPEQTDMMPKSLGPWTDVYLLAGILYYIISGEFPHPGPGSQESFRQARRGYFRPLSEVVTPDRSPDPDLIRITERALSKSPADRPQNAGAFLKEIQEYRRGANRKRQARELVAEAHEEIATAKSYDDYNKTIGKLERAVMLWPQHPEAASLRSKAIEGNARAALDNGDLVLARLLTQRIEEEQRAILTREIEEEEEALALKELHRRRATFLVRALAAVLLIGAVTSVYIMSNLLRASQESQQRAEEARYETEQGRKNATQFINYFATTLVPRVSNLNDETFENEVIDHALKYFETVPEDFIQVDDQRAYMYALLYKARLLLGKDDLDGAQRYLEMARVRYEKFYVPKVEDTRRYKRATQYDQVQLLWTEGELFWARDDYESANTKLEEALALAKIQTEERPDERTFWGLHIDIILDLFKLSAEMGQINVQYFRDAQGTIKAALALHPDDWYLLYGEARLYKARAGLGSGARADNDYQKAQLILEPLMRKYPERRAIRSTMMSVVAGRAQNLAFSDELEDSLPFFEIASFWMEDIPKDLGLGYNGVNITIFYSVWAEALLTNNDREAARPKLEAVVEAYQGVYDAGARRDVIINNYAWNLYLLARAIDPEFRSPESREKLVKAETILESIPEDQWKTIMKATYVFIQLALGNVENARPYAEELKEKEFVYEGWERVLKRAELVED